VVSRWPSAVPPWRALRVVEEPLIGFNNLQGSFERDWRFRLVGAPSFSSPTATNSSTATITLRNGRKRS
jgi:hypothetical protein